VRAIIGQQLSVKGAAAIDARLRALTGDSHDPDGLRRIGEAGLRSVGLSRAKAEYVLNLCDAIHTERLPLTRIGTWGDDTIIERLTEIRGIGRWTADMFLIFALNRPDVLPVGDLGLRVALQRHYALDSVPAPKECIALAESWRPHRTVASWYLWRSLE
jgi:DNA-3-methyladenine glycosylase II